MRSDQVIFAKLQDKNIEKIFYKTKLLYEHNENKPLELSFPLNIYKTSLMKKKASILQKLEFIYYEDFFNRFSTVPNSKHEYIVFLYDNKQQSQKDFYLNKEGSIIFYTTYDPINKGNYNGWIVCATKKVVAKNNKIDFSFIEKHWWGSYSYRSAKEIKFNNILKLEYPNQPVDLSNLFYKWENLENLSDIHTIGIRQISNLEGAFYDCKKIQSVDNLFSNIELSEVKSLKSCFEGCKVLRNIDFSHIRLASNCDNDGLNRTFANSFIFGVNEAIQYINTNYLTKLEATFQRFCQYLSHINNASGDLWNPLILDEQRFIPGTEEFERYCELYPTTSGWEDWQFRRPFADEYLSNILSSLDIDLENKDFSNITTIEGLFDQSQVHKIYLSNLNTLNLTNMAVTFRSCKANEIIGLNTWNTQNVTTLQECFYYARIENIIDLRNNDFKKVINYYGSFFSPLYEYEDPSLGGHLQIKFDFDNNIWYNLESVDRQYYYSFGCDLSSMGDTINFTKVFNESNLEKVRHMFNHAIIHTLNLNNKTFTTDITINVTDYHGPAGLYLKQIEYDGNFSLWKNNIVFSDCYIKNFYGNNITLNVTGTIDSSISSNNTVDEFDKILRNPPSYIDGVQTAIILPNPEDTYNLLDVIVSSAYIENFYINNLTFTDYMIPWLKNQKEYLKLNISPNVDASKYKLLLQGDFFTWEKNLFESTLEELDLTGFSFPQGYEDLCIGHFPNSDFSIDYCPNKITLNNSNITRIYIPVDSSTKLRKLNLQNMQNNIDSILTPYNLSTVTELNISNNTWLGSGMTIQGPLQKLDMSNISPTSRYTIGSFNLICPLLTELLYQNTKFNDNIEGIIIEIEALGNNNTSLDLNDLFNTNGYNSSVHLKYLQITCPTLTSLSLPDYTHAHVWIEDNSYQLNSNLNFINCKNLIEINRINDFNPLRKEDTLSLKKVSNLRSMFEGCESLPTNYIREILWQATPDKTPKTYNLINTFKNCKALTEVDLAMWIGFINDAPAASIKNKISYISNCFEGCENLEQVKLNLSINSDNYSETFKNCINLSSIIGNISKSNLYLYQTFLNCQSLTNIKLKGSFDNMYQCFKGCSSLNSLDISDLTPSTSPSHGYTNVNFSSVFEDCSSLTSIDFSGFSDTSKIRGLDKLFKNCSSLTSIDLSVFSDITDLISMNSIFEGCSNLNTIDMTFLNTSSTVEMESLFEGCTNLLSVDVSTFDVQNSYSFKNMFKNCSSLSTVKLFNFDNRKRNMDLTSMFENCYSLYNLDFKNFIFDFSYGIETAYDGSPILYINSMRNITNLFAGCRNLHTIYVDNQENKAQEKYNYLKTHEFIGYETRLNRCFSDTEYNEMGRKAFERCLTLSGDNDISYQQQSIEDPEFFTSQQYATAANGYFTYRAT